MIELDTPLSFVNAVHFLAEVNLLRDFLRALKGLKAFLILFSISLALLSNFLPEGAQLLSFCRLKR
jgi:hypothetical protein